MEIEGNKFRSSEVQARAPERAPARGARGSASEEADEDQEAEGADDDAGEPSPPARRHRGRDGTTIFDGDRQVFYTVDDGKKTYQRMDEASGAAMAKAVQAQMEKMKERMTPEQRAQLDRELAKQKAQPSKGPPKELAWTFQRTKGGQKVAGYSCDNYRVLHGGKPSQEGCFIPWGTGGFDRNDFKVFQQMGRFMERISRSMSEGLGSAAPQAGSGAWTQQLDAWPGVPALMKDVEEDGSTSKEMRLVKVQRSPIPASRFTVPAGYRERPLMATDPD
jgi:hypothetical protein